MATTFEAASQSFGAPRSSTGLLSTARRLWASLVSAVMSADSARDSMTPAELLQLADQYESTSPSLAADLRAAALLSERSVGV